MPIKHLNASWGEQTIGSPRILNDVLIKIGVFVNPHLDLVNEAIKKVPIDIIQFHGNESDAFINSFNIPKIKVIKVKDNIEDFFEFNNTLLFDTYSNTSEGGPGRAFNWSLLNHYKNLLF